MGKQLRLGIMGTSYPCLRHGEAFQALKGVQLAAVADPNDKRRKEFVRKFGAMEEYLDYHDMLAKAKLDAVVIGLPTGMHAQACMESFDAGLHVMCEKPPTTTTGEMTRVARKAQQSGLTYMFCRQFRFSNASLRARELASSGRLGKVYHADAKWVRTRFLPTGAGSWRVSRKEGGGVLLDLGIHAIDEAWFVLGCPRPVEVMAGLHCAFSHFAARGQDYSADDATVGMIRFENGATLHFAVSFSLNWPGTLPLTSDGKPMNAELRETMIYGTHGGAQICNGNGGQQIISLRRGVRLCPIPAWQPTGDTAPVPMFVRQAKDFLRAIREGVTPTNSAEQAVMLMQMLDALRKSGDTRRSVRIRKFEQRNAFPAFAH